MEDHNTQRISAYSKVLEQRFLSRSAPPLLGATGSILAKLGLWVSGMLEVVGSVSSLGLEI